MNEEFRLSDLHTEEEGLATAEYGIVMLAAVKAIRRTWKDQLSPLPQRGRTAAEYADFRGVVNERYP